MQRLEKIFLSYWGNSDVELVWALAEFTNGAMPSYDETLIRRN
jgi:hypothetical protein